MTLEDDTLMQWCVDNDFCGEAVKAVRYDEYSCAVTPQIRQTGNRLSDNAETTYASLLA